MKLEELEEKKPCMMCNHGYYTLSGDGKTIICFHCHHIIDKEQWEKL